MGGWTAGHRGSQKITTAATPRPLHNTPTSTPTPPHHHLTRKKQVGRAPQPLTTFLAHLQDLGIDLRRCESKLLAAHAAAHRPLAGQPPAGEAAAAAAVAARQLAVARVGTLAWGRVPLPLPRAAPAAGFGSGRRGAGRLRQAAAAGAPPAAAAVAAVAVRQQQEVEQPPATPQPGSQGAPAAEGSSQQGASGSGSPVAAVAAASSGTATAAAAEAAPKRKRGRPKKVVDGSDGAVTEPATSSLLPDPAPQQTAPPAVAQTGAAAVPPPAAAPTPAAPSAPPTPTQAAPPAGEEPPDAELWWPCEVIDPWTPPTGFELRLQHLLALPAGQRAACAPPHDLERLSSVLDAARPAAAAASAAGAPGGPGGWASPPGASRRLLLVLWFGGASFEWRRGRELVPFADCRKHMEGECDGFLHCWLTPDHKPLAPATKRK